MKKTRVLLAGLLTLCSAWPASAKVYKKKAKHAAKPAAAPKAVDPMKSGMAHLDQREYSAAISDFQRAVQQRGDSARYFLLGYAYFQRGFMNGAPENADKKDAIEIVNSYTTAIALDPNLTEIEQPFRLYHGLGMAYEALGSNEKAVDAYRKAFAMDPTNPLLPLYGARLRLRMGESDKALMNLETALKRARAVGQDGALVAMVKTNPMFAIMLQDPDEARLLRQYDPAIAAPSRPAPKAPAPMGQLVAMQPKAAAAAADAYGMRDSVANTAPKQTMPARSEQDQSVLDNVASANDDFKFRRWGTAVEEYSAALNMNAKAGTLSPGQVAFVQERLGTSYNRMGQTTEAITALQRSVQSMPYNSAAHYQLAIAYSVSGHFNEAMKALRESFKTAASTGELKKTMLLAKTDVELEPLRDMPSFQSVLNDYAERAYTAKGKAGR